MNNFAEKLKNARIKKGLTQTELAEILDIRQNSYTRIESGNYDTKMSNILKICKALDISADYLLGLTEEDTIQENTEEKEN